MATKKNVSVVVSMTIAVSTFLLVSKKTCGDETNDNKAASPPVVSTDTGRVFVASEVSTTEPSEHFERPQRSFQLRVSAVKIWPGDDDSWEKASGANMDTIYWSTPSLGFGFELGFHSWYAKTQSMLETFSYQYTEQHYYPSTRRYVPGYYYYGYGGWLYYRPGYYQTVPGYYYTDMHTGIGTATWTFSGKDRQISVGPKVIGAKQHGKLRLTSELAVLYVMHDSDVTIGYRDNTGTTPFEVNVDLENSLVAKLAAGIACKLSSSLGVFANVGYQFDLMKGEAKVDAGDETIYGGKNEIKGACGALGVTIGM